MEKAMKKKDIALQAISCLRERYPDAICSLTYTDALQLLIATRLSAQCTDARVNLVTPAPVSYTHLDVYKRQTLYRFISFNPFSNNKKPVENRLSWTYNRGINADAAPAAVQSE